MRDIWTHTHTQIRATYHVLFPEIVHEEEVGGEWPLWRVRVFRLFRFLHLLAVLRIRLAPARDWIRVHLEEFRLDFVLGATHTHTHTHTHAWTWSGVVNARHSHIQFSRGLGTGNRNVVWSLYEDEESYAATRTIWHTCICTHTQARTFLWAASSSYGFFSSGVSAPHLIAPALATSVTFLKPSGLTR